MMQNVEKVDVFFHEKKVGTLAPYQKYRTAFEYDPVWLGEDFSISPFSLPLEEKLFISKADPFEGLFGVFDDHLPDGWGRLVLDRYLASKGIKPDALTALTRLTLISQDSFGGLEFRPAQLERLEASAPLDYDTLYQEAKGLLKSPASGDLDSIFLSGGSSGGARPKVNVMIDGDMYLVKFPGHGDREDVGVMEHRYLECAAKCGIEVPEHRLLPSRLTPGFLALRRFDRPQRPHMISMCGLLETSHRYPALDYRHIFRSLQILSRSSAELMKLYRLMCFNLFAGNQDDHGKNFTFIREDRGWRLSPAYDLTRSEGLYGERATTVNGKGKDIDLDDLASYARGFQLDEKQLKRIALEIEEIVRAELGEYL